MERGAVEREIDRERESDNPPHPGSRRAGARAGRGAPQRARECAERPRARRAPRRAPRRPRALSLARACVPSGVAVGRPVRCARTLATKLEALDYI